MKRLAIFGILKRSIGILEAPKVYSPVFLGHLPVSWGLDGALMILEGQGAGNVWTSTTGFLGRMKAMY